MQDKIDVEQLVAWDSLSVDEQLRLRIDYGHYLDSLPPVCSMDTKIERFRRWLAEQHGVAYDVQRQR